MSSSSIYSCVDAYIERVIEFQLHLNDKTKLRMLLADVRARESLNEKCFRFVKEFSFFLGSNQTVRHRFRCMYYMFSSCS